MKNETLKKIKSALETILTAISNEIGEEYVQDVLIESPEAEQPKQRKKCVHRITFKHGMSVKFVGYRLRPYHTVKEFCEEIANCKYPPKATCPIDHHRKSATREEAIVVMKKETQRFVNEYRPDLVIEKIVRFGTDGNRYEA